MATRKKQKPMRRREQRKFAGVSMRLDAETEARLDVLAARLGGAEGRLTRAHVAREAMLRGLLVLEHERRAGEDAVSVFGTVGAALAAGDRSRPEGK